MRRLSIIDLAGGDQPIANEDGRIQVVQNGEIYNYRELRDELRGARAHASRTHSDTEVLVHLYEERGAGVRRGAARDVRDRASGTPASGGCCSRATASASSRSTTASPAGSSPSPRSSRRCSGSPASRARSTRDALEAFLAFNSIPAPLTIFARGAQAARRAHADRREGGGRGRAATRARRPRRPIEVRDEGDEALAEELRDRLRDSVRAHLVSDVPVGVLLSGGIDSAALDRAGRGGERLPGQHLLDRLRGAAPSTSSSQARLVAERYGTDHHELVLRPDAVDLLPAPGRGLRRALRRLLGAPHLPGLAARRGHGQGRRSPARAATSSSAATTPTSPTGSRPASAGPRRSCARWSSGCRAPPRR